MKNLAWHQVFSNYHNIGFQPNDKTAHFRIKQNLTGTRIQVELSNEFDAAPLTIEGIKVSLFSDFNQSLALTFEGKRAFEIPAGEHLWTDLMDFTVPKGHDLYFELSVRNETNLLATSANLLSRELVTTDIQADCTFLYGLTSVKLDTENQAFSIGFFGDSLTNQGHFSDATLLKLYQKELNVTGFNAGISGNRLLLAGTSDSQWRDSFGDAAIKRFNKDVVTYQPDMVVGLMGVNDLFHPGTGSALDELPTAEEMIAGLQQLLNEAAAHGIRYVPLTLPPFAGSINREIVSWSKEKEAIRFEVNTWLRTLPDTIDVAGLLEDPNDSTKLKETFDCGDHLHFSKSGGQVLGVFLANQLQPMIKAQLINRKEAI